jgi:hypothetical protein
VEPAWTSLQSLDPNADEADGCALDVWLNETYLNPEHMESISEMLIEESFVELMDVLDVDMYQRLYDAWNTLEQHSNVWTHLGPPNVRRFSVPKSISDFSSNNNCTLSDDVQAALKLVTDFQAVLVSPPFLTWLGDISNLQCSKYHMSVRLFQPGDYSLLHDNVREEGGCLDVYVDFTASEDWNPDDYGGAVTYMDADDHLLSVVPMRNCMSLVYRDEGGAVMRFTKYVNHQAPCPRRDIAVTFKAE